MLIIVNFLCEIIFWEVLNQIIFAGHTFSFLGGVESIWFLILKFLAKSSLLSVQSLALNFYPQE